VRAILTVFICIPIVEMVVLIKVGGVVGVLPTIALVFLTAMLGLALLKHQGLSTLLRAREKMRTGELPVREIIEGIFLAVGGALLLTPGFVTDLIGFCCLIPGVRYLVIAWGMRLFKPNISYHHTSSGAQNHQTLNGEFKRED